MSSHEVIVFGAGDYAVFATMLVVSLAIGVYYAIKDRKSKSTQNYLLGGRKMNYFAVGTSASFSFISAVTILGIPSEIYLFGSMYIWLLLSITISLLVVNEIYVVLYFRVRITSSYEYLEKRFSYAIRVIGTLAYIAQTVMYIGVMIYAPSLAFSQVSGFNLWAAIFITGIVCTIYTTLGGLKAVIWTDVFQGCIVIIITIVVMFMSANEAGGWNQVWLANSNTGRFNFFEFDLDPRVRHSFWSVVVGLGMLWTSIFGTTQSQVQRYLACSTAANAKKALYFALVLAFIVITMSIATGWVMYAYFQGCDPLFTRRVSAPDQLLPYMVMLIFRNLPGLSGAFMASVYAGCLSTVSTGINAMACVTSEDFIRPFVKWSDSRNMLVAKALVFLYGLICIGFACLSTILGNVLQTSLTLLGVLGGPTMAMYTLGVIFPFANSWGAGVGFFAGLAFISWIYGGSRLYQLPIQFLRPKPRTIANCRVAQMTTVASTNITSFTGVTMSSTTPAVSDILTTMGSNGTNILTTAAAAMPTPAARPPIAEFYAVSYAYYTAIGFAVTLLIGLIISLGTGGHKKAKYIDPLLVIPIFDHPLFKPSLPKSFRRMMWCGIDRDAVNKFEAPSPVPIVTVTKPANGEENPGFEMTEDSTKL